MAEAARNYYETDKEIRTAKAPSVAEIEKMVLLAKQKGWQSLSLTGSQEYKNQVWLVAQRNGMSVKDFVPSPAVAAQWNKERTKKANLLATFMNKAEDKKAANNSRSKLKVHQGSLEPENKTKKKRPALRLLSRVCNALQNPFIQVPLMVGAAIVGPGACIGLALANQIITTVKDFQKEHARVKAAEARIKDFADRGISARGMYGRDADKFNYLKPIGRLALRMACVFGGGAIMGSVMGSSSEGIGCQPVGLALASFYGIAHTCSAWREKTRNDPTATTYDKFKAAAGMGVQMLGMIAMTHVAGAYFNHNWGGPAPVDQLTGATRTPFTAALGKLVSWQR